MPRAKPVLGQVVSLLKPKGPCIRYTTIPATPSNSAARREISSLAFAIGNVDFC
jgi:hypothetical protein